MARKYNRYGANEKNYTPVEDKEVSVEFFEEIVAHPQFDELMTMIEEAISKPYDGGIQINNCWPEDWNNKQVGFLIWFIQTQYKQVVHSQFYGDNGLYVEIKNKDSKIVSTLQLEDSFQPLQLPQLKKI
jgi:hypothetical protein